MKMFHELPREEQERIREEFRKKGGLCCQFCGRNTRVITTRRRDGRVVRWRRCVSDECEFLRRSVERYD